MRRIWKALVNCLRPAPLQVSWIPEPPDLRSELEIALDEMIGYLDRL